MNMLGNHDTERILTVLNDDIDLLKLAVVLQMTLPGVPMIYYGDEVGLTGGKDPLNRKTYPWGKENKDIFEVYRILTNLRNKEELLKHGDIMFLKSDDKILYFERSCENRKIIVILNSSKDKISFIIKNISYNLKDLISGEEFNNTQNNEVEIILDGVDFKILK
jgi:pullulanase